MLPTKMLVTCVTCKIMTCEMISQKDFTLAKTNPLTLIQNLEILGALILMLPTKMSVTCEMITQSWILPLREWGASNVYLSAGQHYLRGKHCRRPIAVMGFAFRQKEFTLANTNPFTLIENLKILGALILMLPTKMSVTCVTCKIMTWIYP